MQCQCFSTGGSKEPPHRERWFFVAPAGSGRSGRGCEVSPSAPFPPPPPPQTWSIEPSPSTAAPGSCQSPARSAPQTPGHTHRNSSLSLMRTLTYIHPLGLYSNLYHHLYIYNPNPNNFYWWQSPCGDLLFVPLITMCLQIFVPIKWRQTYKVVYRLTLTLWKRIPIFTITAARLTTHLTFTFNHTCIKPTLNPKM